MAYDIWETCVLVPGLKQSVCAAWVQAWGSILAIVAAGAVVYAQHALERRRAIQAQRENDRRVLTVAHMCAVEAHRFAHAVGSFRTRPGAKEARGDRDHFRGELELLVGTVRSVELMQLPTASALKCVVAVHRQLQLATALLAKREGALAEASEVTCTEEYGRPWLSIHGTIGDQVAYLDWELRRLDNPNTPHPSE